MIVQVPYTVPVMAVVDTKAGTVLRVVTIDEEIRLNSNEPVVRHDPYGEVVSTKKAEKAERIAETADWPSWENGF